MLIPQKINREDITSFPVGIVFFYESKGHIYTR